jgi:hypothetical protein
MSTSQEQATCRLVTAMTFVPNSKDDRFCEDKSEAFIAIFPLPQPLLVLGLFGCAWSVSELRLSLAMPKEQSDLPISYAE